MDNLRGPQVKNQSGQVLVLLALALPLFFAVCLLVVDGSRLFVQKRTMQNAADASALAAAKELTLGATCDVTCQGKVLAKAQDYSSANDGPNSLTNCNGVASATDCYQLSNGDQTIQVRLRSPSPVANFFGPVLSLFGGSISTFRPSASAAASKVPINQQYCQYADGTIDPTWQPGDPPCTRTGSQTGTYAYAASTSCSAITISSGSDNFRDGALWSNGGISASGANDTVKSYQLGDTAHCAGVSEFVDGGGQTTPPYTGPIVPPTYVPTRAVGDWPVPLPDVATVCAATGGVINTGATIDAAWMTANPTPGVYCYTGKIVIKVGWGSGMPYPKGYAFVSTTSTDSAAVGSSSAPLEFDSSTGTDLLFYAVKGGVKFTGGAGFTLNGSVYAPLGTVEMTGGNNTQTGFIEANAIKLSNNGTKFLGTGPGQPGPTETGAIKSTAVGDKLSLSE
jgi:Flp pilus assembly protein TadG